MTQKNHAPLVSIITVTFNAEATLKETIESIQAQTYPHIEHIIVDGKSRDNTLAIASHYQSRIAKIISEPDKGLYDAMNKGLNLAQGEWIIFLNAGDYFHDHNTLSEVSRLMTDENDMIYSDVICDYGDFKKTLVAPPEHKVLSIIKRKMCIYHNAVFIRTGLHKKFHYNMDYRIAADYDVLLRLVIAGARLKRFDRAIATIETGGGISYLNQLAALRERRRVIMKNATELSGIIYNAVLMISVIFKAMLKKCLPNSLTRLIIKYKQ